MVKGKVLLFLTAGLMSLTSLSWAGFWEAGAESGLPSAVQSSWPEKPPAVSPADFSGGQKPGPSAWAGKLIPCQTLKGDMNGNRVLDETDIVLLANCVFLGQGNCGTCYAELNCDGILTSSDLILLLRAVFLEERILCGIR